MATKSVKDQSALKLDNPNQTDVESYEFEPIKGYPMLRWQGKRPFNSTQYYPAQLKEVHGEEVVMLIFGTALFLIPLYVHQKDTRQNITLS